MKKVKKILLVFVSAFIILLIVLSIYAANPYTALDEMDDAIALLDTSSIQINDDFDEITYTVDNPIKQIVFMPGGKVKPDSYSYLAINLALEGYNVTIFKPLYNLAILTPNYAKRFLSEDLDNIVIGHSLGGVVGSMVASGNDLVSEVILMGSYPIKDLTDKDVLLISAEYDIAMDQEKFDESLQYLNEDKLIIDIEGGNHAQFGWYGPQKGDGEATIDTQSQQDLVIDLILDFLNN